MLKVNETKSKQAIKFILKKTTHKNELKNILKNTNLVLSEFRFNNVNINYNQKLDSFLSHSFFGINKYFLSKIEERVEISKKIVFNNYGIDKWFSLSLYLSELLPNNKSIKDKLVLNLVFLFLIKTYKGWRHAFNLPTRGQRTWSNALSRNKTKNFLRDYKFNCFKVGLGNCSGEDIKNAFYLEQLNSLWKWQWEKEWQIAFKKRQSQLKKTRGAKRIELSSLASVNPNFTKSKKQLIMPVGFEHGFTKNYLKSFKKQKTKKK